MRSGASVTVGWMADRILGEPPTRFHPVVWFGNGMRLLEQKTYRDSRLAGVVHVMVGIGIAVAVGRSATKLMGRHVATGVMVGICVAGKMLADEATKITVAVEFDDLATAREQLPTLVGRDPTVLTESEILRAIIESLAENTNDAVIASMFWASIGGAPAVLVHRAINILDAMIGHHNDRYENFGWAAARLDDIANYLPARVAAFGLAILCPDRARAIFRAVTRDAHRHPSPNGGVIEAAMAAALDVQLGGVNVYDDRLENRGTLGGFRTPKAADARRAIVLTNRLGALAAVTAALRR